MTPGYITTLPLYWRKIISLHLFKSVEDDLGGIKVNHFKGGIPEHHTTNHLFNPTWRLLKKRYRLVGITIYYSAFKNQLITDIILE